MTTYDELMHGVPVCDVGVNGRTMQGDGDFVDAKLPCLLLLRCSKRSSEAHMPLVIAHSLLGDHRGYGRLWNSALQRMDVYALRHRGLTGLEACTLDRVGAMSMVNEYATALAAWFANSPFDLIGASPLVFPPVFFPPSLFSFLSPILPLASSNPSLGMLQVRLLALSSRRTLRVRPTQPEVDHDASSSSTHRPQCQATCPCQRCSRVSALLLWEFS